MGLKRYVPQSLKEYVKLQRILKANPAASYIRSPHISTQAELGRGVGIGQEVIVNPGVNIGDHTYANRGAIIFSGTIGRFCSIAHYSQIGAEQHPVEHLSTSPYMYGPNSVTGGASGFDEFQQPPIIGSDVWVGSNAVIMQGVTIGHGAIIAAGAVVTKDVAPYSIVGGVPAKLIRKRFSEDTIADLLEWAWWDLPIEDIRNLRPLIEAGSNWKARRSG